MEEKGLDELDMSRDLNEYSMIFTKDNKPVENYDDVDLLFYRGCLRFQGKNNRLKYLFPLKDSAIAIRLILIGLCEFYLIHKKRTFKLNDFIQFLGHKQNYSRYLLYIYLMKQVRQIKKDDFYYNTIEDCVSAEDKLKEPNLKIEKTIPLVSIQGFQKSYLKIYRLTKLKIISNINLLGQTTFIDIYQVQSRTHINIAELPQLEEKLVTYDEVRLNKSFMILLKRFVYSKLLF